MPTIAACLTTLGVPVTSLGACHDLTEEWAIVKKGYFRSALANHPDKGGDSTTFRNIQSAFEALRALFESQAVSCLASSAAKEVAQGSMTSELPSWEYYAHAAEEPVPPYRVEPAKSARSKCAVTGETIPLDALRVGSLNHETGTYGRWALLAKWRVPSRVWLGLPDPDACTDAELFKAGLLSMSSVVLSGVGELGPEQVVEFTSHCMQKGAWAKLTKRKDVPPPDQALDAAPAAAPTAASSALGKAQATSALVADKPGDQRFMVPVPGKDGPANSLAGKTVVLTGIFPEVGGRATHGAQLPQRLQCTHMHH